jgi:hypothetical protein
MEFPVGKIVVVDEEVLAGGNAEGKRSACTDVILALGDCGENFGPSGLVGTKAWLQVISSTNRLTIVYRRVIRQLRKAEPRQIANCDSLTRYGTLGQLTSTSEFVMMLITSPEGINTEVRYGAGNGGRGLRRGLLTLSCVILVLLTTCLMRFSCSRIRCARFFPSANPLRRASHQDPWQFQLGGTSAEDADL